MYHTWDIRLVTYIIYSVFLGGLPKFFMGGIHLYMYDVIHKYIWRHPYIHMTWYIYIYIYMTSSIYTYDVIHIYTYDFIDIYILRHCKDLVIGGLTKIFHGGTQTNFLGGLTEKFSPSIHVTCHTLTSSLWGYAHAFEDSFSLLRVRASLHTPYTARACYTPHSRASPWPLDTLHSSRKYRHTLCTTHDSPYPLPPACSIDVSIFAARTGTLIYYSRRCPWRFLTKL